MDEMEWNERNGNGMEWTTNGNEYLEGMEYSETETKELNDQNFP